MDVEPAAKKARNGVDPGSLEGRMINTIRALSADTVQSANSGHPGAPMGCAPMAHTLFTKVMKYNPANPAWANRDRFVLSNGHGCALLYTMLHLTGYEHPTMEELSQFRQLGSVTAGHPENFLLDAVEVSTGPLGQGIANAVGMAIAERHLAATFNKPGLDLVDSHTFVICGDGCLQEGVSAEASSLAGHLKLGKLTVLYDDNDIQIDGGTNLAFTEDVKMRYESYGWQVLVLADGNSDVAGLEALIAEARACTDKPTMIKVKTTIGFGSAKQGTHGVHGAPLGAEDIANVKTSFGLDPSQSFTVPEDVLGAYRGQVGKGAAAEAAWRGVAASYQKQFPAEFAEYARRMAGELPANWQSVLPRFTPADGAIATRNSSGKVLNALAEVLPELMGGSADLTPSNKTALKCSGDFQAATPEGRYLRFGVREHGMVAVCNGITAYGGAIPYCATFLNFAGYALGGIRLSALSQFRVIYIMTHDSIGLGEDGPTHQPVAMLVTLRAIPNMFVFRPADANEVSGSYAWAIANGGKPSLFALSRQNLPCLEHSSVEAVAKGAYTVHNSGAAPAVVLVATGSEVSICMDAAQALAAKGVSANVVSMPCMELYDLQDTEYKKSVFPEGVPVVSVEAAAKTGWAKYSHYQMGLETFGKSAPYKKLYEYFGLTAENIADKAAKLVAHYRGKPIAWLADAPQL